MSACPNHAPAEILIVLFFACRLLVKFPFIGELPINSVLMPSSAWPVENLARPGPFGHLTYSARPAGGPARA